jgi:hypothetical protein
MRVMAISLGGLGTYVAYSFGNNVAQCKASAQYGIRYTTPYPYSTGLVDLSQFSSIIHPHHSSNQFLHAILYFFIVIVTAETKLTVRNCTFA